MLYSPSFTQAGSFFPDWGYQCLGNNQQSEDGIVQTRTLLYSYLCLAHWPAFIKEAVNYIRDVYPIQTFHTNNHVRGLISFVFAIMSHGIADVKWHSLKGLSDYFMIAMANSDFHGNVEEAHTAADAGAEFTLRHSSKLSYINETWQVPVKDIIQIYKRLYATEPYAGRRVPLKSHIQYCMTAAFAASKVDVEFGQFMFGYYGSKSPFLTEELYDYFKGGIEDLSGSVSDCYSELIHAFENGATHSWPDYLCSDYFYADIMSSNSRCVNRYPKPRLASESIYRDYNPVTGVFTITVRKNEKTLEQNESLLPLTTAVPPQDYETNNKQTPISLRTNKLNNKCLSLDHEDLLQITLSMPMTSARVGHQIVSGDFNGNKKTDMAISAPYYVNQDTHLQSGAVYVLDSAVSMIPSRQSEPHVAHDIRDLSQIVLEGNVHHGRFGWSMLSIDMNQDGIDDLAVSTPFKDGGGRIDIFLGQAHLGLSRQPGIQIQLPLFDLKGTVLAAIDVDHDGHHDLVVGCPLCSVSGQPQVGVVHVFKSFCKTCTTSILTQPDISIQNPNKSPYDRFGESILIVKDTLLIGAPGYSTGTKQRVGRVYAFDSYLQLRWTITGSKEFQQYGRVLATDDNNDIVVISSPSEETVVGLRKYWQAGVVRLYKWERLQPPREEVAPDLDTERGMMSMIKGRTNAGHLGQSLSVFSNEDGGGIWIGEPMSEQENGRIYRWSFDQDMECIKNNQVLLVSVPEAD
ncbi:uncharacterized protein B0P05DRAFT_545998 [Gilbertella persicaria]|uniref:uncharacterized protein n=1 Tax=Gilbertella persicaria TaxID=101096 RepID=UPI0022202F0E|nr:uncharacterized protein B0P05DRAFT_545998 [Gilbertella persicaria]KAI8076472.1 hypothetical protein B0P05DRAFT_545998 [Gilbertella persicaria]